MNMIILNITTYVGLCSDAKHLYAKYTDTNTEKNIDERKYIESLARKGRYSVAVEELKRFPTYDEAKILAEDDCYIDMFMENGTIRFDNLHQIEYEINKLFPHEEKVWYYCGDKKLFEEVKDKLYN